MTMFKKRARALAAALAVCLAGAGASPVFAQVTGATSPLTVNAGESGSTNFTLTAGDGGTIDGVNGELLFPAALLTNPRVAPGAGAPGFTAEGNLTADGVYRFVLYKNPPDSPLNLALPALVFTFDAAPGIVGVQNGQATYNDAISAAARVIPGNPPTVLSIGVGGPGGNPPAQDIDFQAFNVTVNGITPPVIASDPKSQSVHSGKDVAFTVGATGAGPLSYEWLKDSTPVTGNAATLSLTGVTAAEAGSYVARVSNAAGSADSNPAALTVNDASVANAATLVGHTIPDTLLPLQNIMVSVTMRNTSALTWAQQQGYALSVTGDAGNLFGGATQLTIMDPAAVVASGTGEYTFMGTIVAPAGTGPQTVTLQMNEPGHGLFGDVVTVNIQVGESFNVDFASNPQGWLGGVLAGTGSTGVTASGLCMTVPAFGDNVVGWISPEHYIPLTQNMVYRLIVGLNTTQTTGDAIPFLNVIYNNFTFSGAGNNYGGEAWFLDVRGGANGIGRAQGRPNFTLFVTPAAAMTQQWNGAVDPANSAFDPSVDSFNDIALNIRLLDLGAASINANFDEGEVCVQSVRVNSYPISSIAVESTAYAQALDNAHYQAETPGQTGGGSAAIDDATNTANYQLAATGAGSRKTLFPFDPSVTNGVNFNLQLYPVVWEQNALYRGRARIRSNVQGGSEGSDPVDSIFLLFDTTNVELGQSHYVTRGAPGNMLFAGSPRLAATTGGTAQDYVGYFYGQNATLDPDQDSNRFRFFVDFFNTDALGGGPASGTDPVTVEAVTVEKMVVPAP